MKEKRCTKCKEIKNILEFCINKRSQDGRNFRCKTCKNEYNKTYMQTEHAKKLHREREKKRRKENPLQYLIDSAKCRAKKIGLDFTLTVDDLTKVEKCPVLGIKLQYVNKNKSNNNSASLDRINNNKGYTKDNVMIISDRANRLKNDGTLEEFEKILDYMENN